MKLFAVVLLFVGNGDDDDDDDGKKMGRREAVGLLKGSLEFPEYSGYG